MAVAASSPTGLGLRALLLCVFDKEEGPSICCSDPPGAVGAKLFKSLGRYLLPDTFVKGRVVSVVLDDNVVLGAPVFIENTVKYDRNIFQFTVCMVISSSAQEAMHRDLAQHLATSFCLLENRLEWLSGGSREEKEQRVQPVLRDLRTQLNASEECYLRIEDSIYVLAFRLRRYNMELAPEPDLDKVALPVVDLKQLATRLERSGPQSDLEGNLAECSIRPDPTLAHLVPLIDGVRSFHQIVGESGLKEYAALNCLRHLLHFGFLMAIDRISLEHRYCLTPDFHRAFLPGTRVCKEVVIYVTAGRQGQNEDLLKVVQRLYAGIDGWRMTLGQFVEVHQAELDTHFISVRHLVTFGLMKGFLKTITSYEQAVSQTDRKKMVHLREDIRERKNLLKKTGYDNEQVNKDNEIQEKVVQLRQLKAQFAGGE